MGINSRRLITLTQSKREGKEARMTAQDPKTGRSDGCLRGHAAL